MEKYGNCNKCYVGYDKGCYMYRYWKSVGKESWHICDRYMTKEKHEEIKSYSRPSRGGTTESDLD